VKFVNTTFNKLHLDALLGMVGFNNDATISFQNIALVDPGVPIILTY
jgi:hypothetical protein